MEPGSIDSKQSCIQTRTRTRGGATDKKLSFANALGFLSMK